MTSKATVRHSIKRSIIVMAMAALVALVATFSMAQLGSAAPACTKSWTTAVDGSWGDPGRAIGTGTIRNDDWKRPMTVAILLRLISGTQANGRVAGRAEIVDTGETQVFKDEKEMLAILERASDVIVGAADPPAFADMGAGEATG